MDTWKTIRKTWPREGAQGPQGERVFKGLCSLRKGMLLVWFSVFCIHLLPDHIFILWPLMLILIFHLLLELGWLEWAVIYVASKFLFPYFYFCLNIIKQSQQTIATLYYFLVHIIHIILFLCYIGVFIVINGGQQQRLYKASTYANSDQYLEFVDGRAAQARHRKSGSFWEAA